MSSCVAFSQIHRQRLSSVFCGSNSTHQSDSNMKTRTRTQDWSRSANIECEPFLCISGRVFALTGRHSHKASRECEQKMANYFPFIEVSTVARPGVNCETRQEILFFAYQQTHTHIFEQDLSISYFHHIPFSSSVSPVSCPVRSLSFSPSWFHGLNFSWMEFSGSNASNNTERTMITIPQMAQRRKNRERKRALWMACTVALICRLTDGCVFSAREWTHIMYTFRDEYCFCCCVYHSHLAWHIPTQHTCKTTRIHFNSFCLFVS